MKSTENHDSVNYRLYAMGVGLALALMAVGCGGGGDPLQPSNSIGLPQLTQPQDGAQVGNAAQPVTLVVQNATVTGSSVLTYTFEVATDSAFTAKVQSRTAVTQGSGQTSLTLDSLAPGRDYYWHARAQTASATGAFSGAFRFTIGSAVTINAPAVVSPANAALTPVRPTFTVSNATRQGPTGAMTYEFDISTTSSFSSILVKGTVPEGQSQTTFTPSADLPSNSALFWRAFAIDGASGVQGTPTAALSFTTGTPLFSGIQPPGTSGHAVLGKGWETRTLVSWDGFLFTSPSLDQRQLFDLMDRGMSPQAAIDWMQANGYPTVAAYYPSVEAIGFPYSYMALVNGQWEIVIRVGA
jgi:hypothetical protein